MPSRMRPLLAAALGLALLAVAAPAAQARARVTIPEFQLEGGAPALSNQLQDGFVLGLVRAGIQVLDPGDTAHKLEAHPELAHCDASPCLKSIGQVLDVGYIVRVKIEVAGNSYKSVARLFSTEGAAPAALPIATESKSCDVCTVAEARATMLRLADAVRSHIDEATPLPAPVAPAAARRRRRTWLVRRCWRWSARWPSPPAPPCSPRRRAARRPTARRTGRATSAAASSSAPARR